MLIGGGIGYFVGYKQNQLTDKLRTLYGYRDEEVPTPTVTMGEYKPPQDVGETNSATGLIESKTPERLEWEASNAIDKEAGVA